MTLIEAQRQVAKILRDADIENAANEARFLLQDALGYDSVQLVTGYRDYACQTCVDTAFEWAKRRAAGEPLQYILGHTDFMGLDIKVAPGVLIPRPETEGLCELLQKAETAPKRILDLCTGSGCIAAWAAHAYPESAVFAADLSEEALAIAAENCKAHESFPEQITLLQGDLFEALPDNTEPFDVIVSNPPYIPSATVETLESEVKDHEPRLALDGGPLGMNLVSRIIEETPAYLTPGGLLLMEIDDAQESLVRNACEASGAYSSSEVLRDLAGRTRYLKAFKKVLAT
ncbi:MAG: peptide chain release factor N(5)-glutamine methyltransferase [Firmicutes bacterium]|nr:peptide chain release factor N(5)-glutamine methyltransferase [Bacillota bacterium]